jgi:hypothetical protein
MNDHQVAAVNTATGDATVLQGFPVRWTPGGLSVLRDRLLADRERGLRVTPSVHDRSLPQASGLSRRCSR